MSKCVKTELTLTPALSHPMGEGESSAVSHDVVSRSLLDGFVKNSKHATAVPPTIRPTPNPSQEGSRTVDTRRQFPSWEGLGVGSGVRVFQSP